MEYVVSVDGGGTKTVLCASDVINQEKHYFYTGCTNFKSTGIEKTMENLEAGIDELIHSLDISIDEIKFWVFGLSGNDSKSDYITLMNMIKNIEPDSSKVYLCNDSELAFYSCGNLPGIVVISGTGSIVVGFDVFGRNIRIGGWGYNISDLGSGYWIGCEALKYLLLYCDGCFEYYPIFHKLIKFYNQKDFNNVQNFVTNLSEYYSIAASAKLIIENAEKGEELCIKIIDEALHYLSLQVYTAYKKLNFSDDIVVDIVMGGGLFSNNFFYNKMKNILIEKYSIKSARFITINNQPVDGGVKIALSKLNKRSKFCDAAISMAT